MQLTASVYYREESESVSELKNVSGSPKLPPGALANGAEGIKESITNFTDARKSDIDNEHLPPDLIDPSDASSFEDLGSGSDNYDDASMIGGIGSNSTAPSSPDGGTRSPSSPALGSEEFNKDDMSPGSPTIGEGTPTNASARFKKGHGRQSSLGTTMTSPSTRRRSLENTISMIREAMSKPDEDMEQLAEMVAGGTGSESPRSPSSPRNSLQGGIPATPGSPSPVR